MKQYFFTVLVAVCAALANVLVPADAHGQSEAVALSMLPVASVGAVLTVVVVEKMS